MRKSAFTLIEIMVVISIISLLVSIVFAGLNVVRSKTRDAQRLNDIARIQAALELYLDDHGKYPDGQADVNPFAPLGICPPPFYMDNSYTNNTAVPTCPPAGGAYPFGRVFIPELAPYLSESPVDPVNDVTKYYIYARVQPSLVSGTTCTDPGRFAYVLIIRDIETSPSIPSPGFCNILGAYGEWITGKFEN